MKKIFIILILINNTHALSDKLLKNGFIGKDMDYLKDQNISNPEKQIILIYNHGQEHHDKPAKNVCVWKNGIRNFASLVGKKINGKEIKLYLLCTDHLAGDDWKRLWTGEKLNPPYKGKPKLEKRLEANLDLIDNFVKKGVPNKQIIVTGHSCGGWLTMMLTARYPNKVGGGISLMQACYGKQSKERKVKKNGVEKALTKFAKLDPGPAKMRQNQIDEISKSKNLLVLVFTHPKDPYDGLLSDWVEKIPGVKRVIISQDKKINGKKCFRIGINNGKEWKEKVKKYHDMDMVDCFQYYNQTILDYITKRVSS
jgi:hypothetical protein